MVNNQAKSITQPAWPATFYFLYFAALAATVPFLALYYQSLGFTGGQIGLLFGISPLITLVASPFWTGLADTRQWHKRVLFITISLVVLLMAVVPMLRSFGLLLAFILLQTFFNAPIVSLADNATLNILGQDRGRYGRIRIWGTIGWGLSAPLVGELLQRLGVQWMFWVYAILMAMNLLVVPNLTFARNSSAIPYWHGIRTLLTNRKWILFLLAAFVAAIGFSLHNNYMAILIQSMNASKSLVGIAITVSILSELPVMFFSNTLLRKFGARGLLFTALAFSGIRCVLYGLVGSPQAVIAVQLLHGLTFPLLWIAAVTFASENAPPGLGATAQGMFGATLMGFGVASGGLLGGFLLDRMSVAAMFGVTGIFIVSGLIVFVVIDYFVNRSNKQGS